MTLFLDSGPIISLTTNNLLWLLEEFHKQGNRFKITESVKKELVDFPLTTKKFKFEAFQVMDLIEAGVLEVVQDSPDTDMLLSIANQCIRARKQAVTIVQRGEIATIATAMQEKADAVVVDERITRLLVEHPHQLANLMTHRLHTQVSVDEKAVHSFLQLTRGVKLFRSVEVVTVAYEKGMLDKYISGSGKELLDSVLWAVKLHGAAVSELEIKEIVRIAKH